MKLVVGLGNIGKEFEETNHNAGFMVLDNVAKLLGFTFKNRGCEADYAEYKNEFDKFIFAKPRTYMNESGRAVKSLMKKFGIDLSDVIVISDDIDQEPGSIRLRKNGSAGTHNGLKSVIAETGSQNFAKLRVGIGKQNQGQDLADFVLSKMRKTKEQIFGIDNATEVIVKYTQGENLDRLMTRFNGDFSKNGKH